jgi:hypothetical protein
MKFLAALIPCALVALAVSVPATARPLLVTFKAAASFDDYSAYQP